MNFCYQIDFHAVGQGLFTSGEIHHNKSIFRWVYDCGTSSQRKLINDKVSSLIPNGDKKLDLVAISHFDQDHINGLITLLGSYEVDTLLLPTLTLEQRLLIGLRTKIQSSSQIMHFLVNPISFLSKPHFYIKRVILVPESIGTVSPIEPPLLDTPFPTLTGDFESVESDTDPPSSRSFTLHQLKPGGRLVTGSFFEFVPYNDSYVWSKVTKSFTAAVRRFKTQLLSQSNKEMRINAIKELRKIYDSNFGNNSMARNMISMFMFAGPIVNHPNQCIVMFQTGSTDHFLFQSKLHNRKCSLYTGDGYLDNKIRLDALKSYYGKQRLERLQCFQVMHHGARTSWHPGVAQSLKPFFSVFSSDPNNKLGHPHADVVRDFLPFHPIQIDKTRDFSLHICCR
ncbi:MAG: hypothetical protein JSS37_09380 [Proteobacteria bacterium]|nr:hypothetical protein [Pseudomonadota bacterium]